MAGSVCCCANTAPCSSEKYPACPAFKCVGNAAAYYKKEIKMQLQKCTSSQAPATPPPPATYCSSPTFLIHSTSHCLHGEVMSCPSRVWNQISMHAAGGKFSEKAKMTSWERHHENMFEKNSIRAVVCNNYWSMCVYVCLCGCVRASSQCLLLFYSWRTNFLIETAVDVSRNLMFFM